jgi:predicted RNase H-like HicB family nuclease
MLLLSYPGIIMSSRALFPTVVWREDDMYVSWCPELDVASQGSTVEEALNNLKEAIELYLEDEDAHVPLEGSTPILAIVRVETHAKAPRSVRQPSC